MTERERRQASKRQSPDSRGIEYEFRGNNELAQRIEEPIWFLSGAAETGKTVAGLTRLNKLAWENDGAQLVIARKRHVDLASTVLQTYEKKILGATRIMGELIGTPVKAYGGERVEFYEYPNGSRIWTAGLDNPGKSLSSERDGIYINQAEETDIDDLETLSTRTTGRAGVIPNAMLFGDLNPMGQNHYLLKKSNDGAVKLLPTYHTDNPSLYKPDGELTEQGERSMARLSALTGHRRKRLFLGLWASPEGLVYEEFGEENIFGDRDFDPNLPIEIAVDDGYIDPRAILFIQRNGAEILVLDELYHSKHLAEVCVNEAVEKSGTYLGWRYLDKETGEPIAETPEAEVRYTEEERKEFKRLPLSAPEIAIGSVEAKELQGRFRKANIPYRGGTHRPLTAGIEIVRRLICDANNYRALKVHRRCKNFINELQEGYMYPSGSNRSNDEVPNDDFNHACDAIRYWCWIRARR